MLQTHNAIISEVMPNEQVGTAFGYTEKVHEEQTPYQKIEIYKTNSFGYLMVIDGCYMLTTRDNFLYHEMMTHPALFTHPDPKNIVIIGGGDCGTLQQVLKHNTIQSAIQIDIDERVTRLSEKYFPELCENNDDPRAKLLFEDGIEWVKRASPHSIDIIIVDSTDPVGPAEGLFSKDFYKNCIAALGDNGILVQQSESPLVHQEITQGMINAMKIAGFSNTATLNFPQPCYPTGWWSALMASKNIDLTQAKIKNKSFVTQYYNSAIHQAALAVPEFLRI